MNDVEAEKLARSYLRKNTELVHTKPSETLALYNFNESEEELFAFRLFGHLSIGSSEYISVSRATGRIRYIGHRGE